MAIYLKVLSTGFVGLRMAIYLKVLSTGFVGLRMAIYLKVLSTGFVGLRMAIYLKVLSTGFVGLRMAIYLKVTKHRFCRFKDGNISQTSIKSLLNYGNALKGRHKINSSMHCTFLLINFTIWVSEFV